MTIPETYLTGSVGSCTVTEWAGETTATASYFRFNIFDPNAGGETVTIEGPPVPNGGSPPPIINDGGSFTVTADVPEPASWMLAGGAVLLGLVKRRSNFRRRV